MVPFAKNSLTNGFEMIMDVEAYDYAVTSTGSEGVILSILHQVERTLWAGLPFGLSKAKSTKFGYFETVC